MTAPLPQGASLPRRIAALFYDALLLLAVLFFCFIPVTIIFEVRGESGGFHPIATLYLLVVCFLFFGWFWTHGGQTLGMRSWRLYLEAADGGTIGWGTALKRFLIALSTLGLGLLWIPFDSRHLAWHDRLSRSYVIYQASED